MKDENADSLGRLSDKCDNLFHASKLPMPDKLHKEQLASAMEDIRDELRKIYIDETGQNPWD